jgi:N-acylneuraminate cytidylyltransferase
MLILSTETNQVTRRRAEKLGLEVAHGIADKGKALQKLMLEREINPSNVVFVGNDQNDLACLEMVGCPVVVSDAHVSVKNIAKVVLEHEGGKGAIRELCDLLISKFIE